MIGSNNLATAATAAASAAASFILGSHVLRSRDATELQSHADILADTSLKSLQALLGVEKIGRNGIFEKSASSGFEFLNLGLAEFKTSLLLLVEFVTPLLHLAKAVAGSVIGEERFHVFLQTAKFGIFSDQRAKFARLFHNR